MVITVIEQSVLCCATSLLSCPTLCDPMDCSLLGSSSMGFSRQEYWRGLPFPSPVTFTTQASNPGLLHCRQILYCLSHKGSPVFCLYNSLQKENNRDFSTASPIFMSFFFFFHIYVLHSLNSQ